MNQAAIFHRSGGSYCYAVDQDTIVLHLQTGKDIEKAYVIWQDPFVNELTRKKNWDGQRYPMEQRIELSEHYLWEYRLKPPYKRLQYYFEVQAGKEHYYVFNNRICPVSEKEQASCLFFKMPWMNPSDIIAPPAWVSKTIWYQIMPDRFCRAKDTPPDPKFIPWGQKKYFGFNHTYGGNLKGITERLPYLQQLGINGLYFTPIFLSDSYHKYNTFDYRKIDPDFGTEDDLRELVQKAHEAGIRVMLDGVFNHCGTAFFAWQDVVRRQKASPYYDWFFINQDDFLQDRFDTADGRYYTFSFWAGMPKLNTNHPEVIRYFSEICSYWVKEWDIDGIRFDVGDEVSHTFLKALRQTLKPLKQDLFLLGEMWFDAQNWLDGTEYDSVMNYPLSSCINDFSRYTNMTANDFMKALNRCLVMYPEQVTAVLFNFLDTHDTVRIAEQCGGNIHLLLQKLTLLLTLPGTPCLYYGTEIALRGYRERDNRRCMPWDALEQGTYDDVLTEVKKLLRLRHEYPALQSTAITFLPNEKAVRLLHYRRHANGQGKDIGVVINGADTDVPLTVEGKLLYADRFDGQTLWPDGTIIYEYS